MERLPFHHRQECLLLCILLCCLATAVRSDTVMWVDTKGKNGSQCIHNSPVGALVPQPPPSMSCKSLLYALQNALNSTFIRVTCGTHKYFKPSNITFPTSLSNVKLVGECTNQWPTVQFMDDSTLAFHGITSVEVRDLVIETGSEDVDQLEVARNNSILYISNCTNVRIQNITVRIAAPQGSGISLRHTDGFGKITLHNVSVLHSGTQGIGIHCNITQLTTGHLTLNMSHILVANINTATTYEPGMAFSGIVITAQGTGNGSQIALHNVTIFNSAPVAGFGLLVRLLQDVHENIVNLAGVRVFDGWNERYHSRGEDVLAECHKRHHDILNMTNGTLENYSAIVVDVQTTNNSIYVKNVQVMASYAPSGSAIAVYFKGLSNQNSIFLENVSLAATGNTIAHRQGLDLQFTGNARENKVQIQNLQVANSTSEMGGGTLLLFTDHSMLNKVAMFNSTFTNHSSKYGGGLCALFQGSSQNNSLSLYLTRVRNNTAELGGGILVIMDDFSSSNSINTYNVILSRNRAVSKRGQLQLSDKLMFKNHTVGRYGGGFAALCLGHTQNNTISVAVFFAAYNTAELGGGITILLDDFARGNVITMQGGFTYTNKAYAGGGMYINFHHLSERNSVALLNFSAYNNDLIPHGNFYTQGGGMNVVFNTSKATSATNNAVFTKLVTFADSSARDGVGGGLSVLYVHSPVMRESGDKVCLESTWFWNNSAANGQAIALQSFPKYRKALFTGITLKNMLFTYFQNFSSFQHASSARDWDLPVYMDYFENQLHYTLNVQMAELMKWSDPIKQVSVNRNTVLLVSVQVRIEDQFLVMCSGLSQGILAIDSEVTLQPNVQAAIGYCVASHGGAIALYGESFIRFPFSSAQLILVRNHAFQRGGALYVDSTHTVCA